MLLVWSLNLTDKDLEQVYFRLQKKQKPYSHLFVILSQSLPSAYPEFFIAPLLLLSVLSLALCLHSIQHTIKLPASKQSNKWILLHLKSIQYYPSQVCLCYTYHAAFWVSCYTDVSFSSTALRSCEFFSLFFFWLSINCFIIKYMHVSKLLTFHVSFLIVSQT